MDTGRKLLRFIENSPVSYQAVDTARKMLEEAGFRVLSETENWQLEAGGKYAVTRNQSSLIAFQLPERELSGFQIAAAHSDSPGFRVKPKAELETEGAYIRLDTEPYGGAIYASWADRPLSIAGRVVVETPDGLEPRLIRIDRDLMVIPHVAIHMNRKVNEGSSYNAHKDMMPLFASLPGKGSFRGLVAQEAGVREEQLLGMDLFLYNRTPGTLWGWQEEFVSAPRLDDLQCAFALLEGFLAARPAAAAPVYALFDNEEVGSLTKQGADSTFLADVLRRISLALGKGEEEYLRLIADSFLVSADNAHAVHPNHPEYADPLNKVYMNRGIVIKYNANQKYTSDGCSEAVFRKLCRDAGVACQTYTNRSDMPGGSTLGNLSNRHVSLRAVDIGLAQLSMHSCYETAGVKDTEDLIRVMEPNFGTKLLTGAHGSVRVSYSC